MRDRRRVQEKRLAGAVPARGGGSRARAGAGAAAVLALAGALACIEPQNPGAGDGDSAADAAAGGGPDAGAPPRDAAWERDVPDARPRADGGGPGGFAGGFAPESAPYGGFGGGDCEAERAPIAFVHGNGDDSLGWAQPASTGGPSVYETFRDAGYSSCELFGVNWLSEGERGLPQYNYHQPAKADLVAEFLDEVLAYTGAEEIDIVAHSMGATVAMHALERSEAWSSVRRYVSVSAPLRGLSVCDSVGYANAAAPACGSQNYLDSDVFGFYRHAPLYAPNPRMGGGGFRAAPERHPDVEFFSLRAGLHDQILCATAGFGGGCGDSALFEDRQNVAAQLHIGHGSTAADLDVGLESWTIFNLDGGDVDGVGHYRSRDNSGPILERMLAGSCAGAACCEGYDAPCEP